MCSDGYFQWYSSNQINYKITVNIQRKSPKYLEEILLKEVTRKIWKTNKTAGIYESRIEEDEIYQNKSLNCSKEVFSA